MNLNTMTNRLLGLTNDKRFLFHICIGVLLRYIVMLIGHNFDFESYKIVGDIASHFGNVYALTNRYNYGPVFMCVQGAFYELARHFPHPMFVYRIFIVGILTVADIGIALHIYKKQNRAMSILFFLNPVSIIITGYHNQFDNIAVLVALIAMKYYNTDPHFKKADLLFIFLTALSIITKHITIFFLFWIFIRPDLPLKKRIAFACIPAFLFLASFIPFFHGAGQTGIIRNVFLYRSFNNMPLIHPVLWMFHISLRRAYFPFFILLICASGFVFRKEKIDRAILLYLICLIAFSSAIANQYLVIPLVSLFILTKYAKYIYVFFMGIFLALDGNGLHLLSILDLFSNPFNFLIHNL